VPFLQSVAGERMTGAPTLVGENGDLVHQVRVLRPASRQDGGDLPDILGDQPGGDSIKPQPQLLPQLRGAAARRLPRAGQQPRVPQLSDLLGAAVSGEIKLPVRQGHQLTRRRERLNQKR
jgi:hypothetical protein